MVDEDAEHGEDPEASKKAPPNSIDPPFDPDVFDLDIFDTGEDGSSPELRHVHKLEAQDVETASPEIGSPTLGVHDATSATHAEGVTIAAASGSAAGLGGAHATGELSSVSVSPMEGSAHGGVGEDDAHEGSAVLRARGILTANAEVVKASSSWTGRQSIPEQVKTITAFAPLARLAVEQVERAVADKRFNDLQTREALDSLKELHRALGELISAAETGEALSPIWDAIEANKERLFKAVERGAKLMVGAPVLSIGMASVLSVLSGFPVTGEMLATLCGSSVIGDALRERKR